MRINILAVLAVPLAAAALGTATGLDGLAAMGVTATIVIDLVSKLRRRDRATARVAAAMMGAAFLLDAIVGHRNPGAPFAVVLGVRTWTVALAAAVASMLDAYGLPEWVDARTKAMERRSVRIGAA